MRLYLIIDDKCVSDVIHHDIDFLKNYIEAFCHGAYSTGARDAMGYVFKGRFDDPSAVRKEHVEPILEYIKEHPWCRR